MDNRKYQIDLNHNQMRILEDALDLYTRVGIGQFEIIAEKIQNLIQFQKANIENQSSWDIRKKWTDPMKEDVLGFPSGASFGIASGNISDQVKVANDMQKAIQKPIAEAENHQNTSVWRYGDTLHLGSEPSIKVEKLDVQKTKQ